jgi:hypothetical protein
LGGFAIVNFKGISYLCLFFHRESLLLHQKYRGNGSLQMRLRMRGKCTTSL